MKTLTLLIVLFSIFLSSCIEPYNVEEAKGVKLLVVDALVTNYDGPYTVLLRYTASDLISASNYIEDAEVTIIDQDGIKYPLNYVNNGQYQTSSSFRGIIGNSYKLAIENDSKLYESDLCLLREPSCIDDVSFEAGTGIYENEEIPTLKFLVDASVCTDDSTFLRWEIKEDWKISLPRAEYIIMVGDSTFEKKENVVSFCYKEMHINNIIIHSFLNSNDKKLVDKDIYSVNTAATDRFTKKYRATVYQYSISKEEYRFWNNLKMTSDETEDFFGKQPFGVIGNIKCITNPKEKALGFFQVAGVSSKEIYVDKFDVINLGLPFFRPQGCKLDTLKVSEESEIFKVYKFRNMGSIWGFKEPYYDYKYSGRVFLGVIFTSGHCAKCISNAASEIPPVGWE